MKKKNLAFTLAEVLITLGVIGVVAAITMPTVIQKYKEARTVSRLKQTYSILSQAFSRAVDDYGTPDNWNLVGYNTTEGSENLLAKLTPYMKTTKICKANEKGCTPDVSYLALDGKTSAGKLYNNKATAKLVNGSLITPFIYSKTCQNAWGTSTQMQNVCASIGVDINGDKKPNQNGVDYFNFHVTKYGIVPYGSPVETSPFKFDTNCRDKSIGMVGAWSVNGYGCAGWVIYNENMDYLHCSDLAWDGKKRCK